MIVFVDHLQPDMLYCFRKTKESEEILSPFCFWTLQPVQRSVRKDGEKKDGGI